MSSSYPKNDATEAIRTLRYQLGEDLHAFADHDVHFFAGYVIGWLRTNLELGDLERVVDELNSTLRVDGHRLLDRTTQSDGKE